MIMKKNSDNNCKKYGSRFYIYTDIYKLPNNLIIYLERKRKIYFIESDLNKIIIDLINFIFYFYKIILI